MRRTIEHWAADYLAIPYLDKGRDAAGVDCWGGVRLVLIDRAGIDPGLFLADYTSATGDVGGVRSLADRETAAGSWDRVESPQPLDVALMRLGAVPHVGVCVAGGDDPAVLHWENGKGASIQRMSDPALRGSLRGWWRWRGNPPVFRDGLDTASPTAAPGGSWRVDPFVVPLGASAPPLWRPEGETVLDMVRATIGAEAAETAVVRLDGRDLDPRHWGRIRPKAGASLELGVVPRGGGGGGKSPLRVFLTLAVIAAAAFGPLALGLQAGTAAFAFASGAIAIGGTLLVNALVPPPALGIGDAASADFSPSISGGRNSARQFRAIPVILGTHRVVPALGALPYTETVGDDQYLRQLFVVGYGPLEITDIRIGETSIDDFQDVEYEIRRGYPGEDLPALFPGVVIEQQFSISLDPFGPSEFTLLATGQTVEVEFPDDIKATDTLTITAVGTVDLIGGTYTTNAAGVIVSPDPTFNGKSPGDIGNSSPYGGSITIGNGTTVAFRQFFDTATNGEGDPTPTTTVTGSADFGDLFSSGEIEDLGRSVKFRVHDVAWNDNSGSYQVTIDNAPDWVQRTSAEDADELAVEITMPAGIGRLVGGVLQPIEIRFEVEYRAVGDTTWLKVFDSDAPDANQTLDGYFGGQQSQFITRRVSLLEHDPLIGPSNFHDTIHWSSSGLDIGGEPQPNRVSASSGMGANYYALEYETDLHITPAVVALTGGRGSPPYTITFAVDGTGPFELFVDDVLAVSRYDEGATEGSGGTPDFSVYQSDPIVFPAYRQDVRLRLRMLRLANTAQTSAQSGAIAVGWKFSTDASFQVIPKRASENAVHPMHYPGGESLGNSQLFSSPLVRYYRITDPAASNELVFYQASSDRVRKTLQWPVPQGQYEVRVRRVTPLYGGLSTQEDSFWTALRTIRRENPINKDGLALIAVRIRATDQLNGVIDELNCVASSIALDYDAAEDLWISRVTSNPASLYRHVLQSPANARRGEFTDARIDLATLEEWHQECETRGLYFNGVIEQRRTLYQVLQTIAPIGRASFTMKDGTFSVVYDRVRTTPVQHITPRNSAAFEGERIFPLIPHALRVSFVNAEAGYVQDERIVLDDGYQFDGVDAFGDPGGVLPEATRLETLDLFGVTSADEAWKHGRYHLAALRLRPEKFRVRMDVEHLAAQRGDLVLLTHDVPLVGIGSGRIHQVEADGSGDLFKLHADEEFVFEAGKDYRVRVRRKTGATMTMNLTTSPGKTSTLELETPIAPPSSGWPEPGDLIMVGEIGTETMELLVDQVAPGEDLSAVLTLVAHAPGIQDADAGTIPPFVSNVTRPPGNQDAPDAPTISGVLSDYTVQTINPDGTITPRMVVSLSTPPTTAPAAETVEVRYRRKAAAGESSATYTVLPVQSIGSGSVSISPVVVGDAYEIRVRVFDALGRPSVFSDTEHTVAGWDLAPDAPAAFDLQELGDGTRRASWTLDDPQPNVLGVLIRWGPSGSAWEDMVPLSPSVQTASPLDTDDPPAGTWAIGAVAVDAQGNESEAVIIERTLGASPSGDTVTVENARIDGWPGTLSAAWINSENCAEVDDTTDWDALSSGSVTWDEWERWNRTPEDAMSYTGEHDAGSVKTLRVSLFTDVVEGEETSEIRYSSDGVAWSEWASAASLNSVPIVARYVEARTTLSGDGTSVLLLCQHAIIVRG